MVVGIGVVGTGEGSVSLFNITDTTPTHIQSMTTMKMIQPTICLRPLRLLPERIPDPEGYREAAGCECRQRV